MAQVVKVPPHGPGKPPKLKEPKPPATPEQFRIHAGTPNESGWSTRATDVQVSPGQNGIVASVRCGGPFAAVYTSAPAAWVGATVQLFGKVGLVRLSLAGPIAIAGLGVPIYIGGQAGGCDMLELEIANAPPFVPAVPVGPLTVSLASWDSGEAFGDSRFVALLEQLVAIAVGLKSNPKG